MRLLAAVEREFELGEHLADDRAELLGQLVLAQRCGGFGVDTLEQAREHLFLDAMNRGLEALDPAVAGFAGRRLALGQTLHRVHLHAGHVTDTAGFARQRHEVDGRELVATLGLGALGATTLHRLGHAEGARRLSSPHSAATSERTHSGKTLPIASRGSCQQFTFC